MADKTEEQNAADKAALDAMRNARANMDAAIRRIDTLESALRSAAHALERAKTFIGENIYPYSANGSPAKQCRALVLDDIAAIQLVLG